MLHWHAYPLVEERMELVYTWYSLPLHRSPLQDFLEVVENVNRPRDDGGNPAVRHIPPNLTQRAAGTRK
jgi:hypothetical protein